MIKMKDEKIVKSDRTKEGFTSWLGVVVIIAIVFLYIAALVNCTIHTIHMVSAGDSISFWWWVLYGVLCLPVNIIWIKIFR